VNHLLFVYGTLKRGCRNHRHIAGQDFVGAARTATGCHLVDLGGYPGIVANGDSGEVEGEVWRVDADALRRLDAFEGVHEGLYRRARISLAAPFNEEAVDAYFPAGEVGGRPMVGACWRE
jgi:gamma-glutamylcyclotransferase (GGCT)/AIG2-like uncharacterized protein YtfP